MPSGILTTAGERAKEMDKNQFYDRELPVDISELGRLREVDKKCHGVYYCAVIPDEDASIIEEYYIVLDDAPITAEARRYGIPLKNSQGLFFDLNDEISGAKIIDYEILRYLASSHLPLPDGADLRECAAYAAELFPEYFGMLPVPTDTPWGHTARYRTLTSGIYWLETDSGIDVLSVSFPIWSAELSDYVLGFSRFFPNDKEMGARFFTEHNYCLAIFELVQTRPDWVKSGRIDLAALMNCIWEKFPEFAVTFNAQEQSGMHDLLGLLLYEPVSDDVSNGSTKNMITYTPWAGTSFLCW